MVKFGLVWCGLVWYGLVWTEIEQNWKWSNRIFKAECGQTEFYKTENDQAEFYETEYL